MKNRIIAGVAILALLGVGLYLWKGRGGDDPKQDEPVADDGKKPQLPQVANKSRTGDAKPIARPKFLAGDDPQGPLRLEGQVIEMDGTPVGGAIVTLTSTPPRTAKTEQDGSFFFDKLIGKGYALSASNDDLYGGPVYANLSEKTDQVIIRVAAASSVAITVVSAADNKPISGATVTLSRVGDRTATADGDGVARFRGVGAGWHSVSAVAPGYAHVSQGLAASSSAGQTIEATLMLPAGVPLSGVVKNSDGKPVSGAYVALRDSSGIGIGSPAKSRSGKNGAFTLNGVAAGTVQVVAHHADYIPGQSEPISVGGTAVKGIEVTVEKGVALTGRVVDAGGNGAAWADVRVAGSGSTFDPFQQFSSNREVHADKDGNFEFKAMPKVKVRLVANDDTASSKPKDLDLTDGKDEDGVELVLDVTGTIAGTVETSAGEPVAEMQVSLFPDLLSGADTALVGLVGGRNATTDGDGKFSFRGLPDGEFMLSADDGTAPEQRMFYSHEKAKTGDTDVRIVMKEKGKIKGTLVYDDGTAAKTFVVTVGWPPGTPVVDDDGKFVLDNIRDGNHDLRFVGPDFAETTKADVIVTGGKTTDIGTVTVKKGRMITGRIVDKGGSPVAGATVLASRQLVGDGKNLSLNIASDEVMRLRRGTSDDSGNYRIRGVPETELVVAAEHAEGGRSLPVELAAGPDSAELNLTLVPVGSVSGKVTRNGEPLPNANVMATSAASYKQTVIAQTDAEGRYLIARLAAGEYKVTAMLGTGMGSVSTGKALTLAAEQKATLDIDISEGKLKLTVNVTGKEGAKVDAAQLFLFAGAVSANNAKELTDAFMRNQGDGARMKLAFSLTASFEKLTARDYTLCTLPITGDMSNPQFLQRLQEAANSLKVYCQKTTVDASPAEQTVSVSVPAMDPLPDPEGGTNEPVQ